MRQYEHEYPSFKFIGPSPIDFNKKKLFGQCVWNKLCKFNLKSYLKKGISKFGIIFNTDPHYLSGSHWICMYISIPLKIIYYFDSNADSTPPQILKFIKKIQDQAKDLGYKLTYIKNTTKHQKSDTECGMYVLYVITQLLKKERKHIQMNMHKSIKRKMKGKLLSTTKKNKKLVTDLFKKRIPDKKMLTLRKELFNQ